MDNINLNLLRCPFCGELPRMKYDYNSEGEPFYQVRHDCKYLLNIINTFCYKSESEAIEKWNKRFINGETSDGYHTFNELYHHRAVLFSVICNANKNRAWKSKSHSDGSMYDGMFIVGIETGLGQATYHYDVDPYWDLFDVKELRFAPMFDGHTPADAIKRIRSLSCEASVPEESS